MTTTDWLTLALVLFTAMLWWVTRRLVIDNGLNARKQIRAYVEASSVRFSGVAVGKRPRMDVAMKNYGATPAKNVRTCVELKLIDEPASENSFDLDVHTPDESVETLGPGADLNSYEVLIDPLRSEDLEALKSKRRCLYAFGLITYMDVFDVSHRTTFRVLIPPRYIQETVLGSRAPRGNSST